MNNRKKLDNIFYRIRLFKQRSQGLKRLGKRWRI